MELSQDNQKVVDDLKAGKKMLAMVAPSFVVDFKYPELVVLLKQMGFDKVCELTFGARIINLYYHEILEKYPDRMFISSACPVVVMMIKQMYPEYAENLVPVVSPIGATARIMHKNYPEHSKLFISPCPAKKEEIKKHYSDIVQNVITYTELKQLIEYAKENNLLSDKKPKSHLFDKFYADYTKIYPLSGGLTKTLSKRGVINEDEIVIIEGPVELKELLGKKVPEKIRFLDVLFCKGGCIGGPGVNSNEPIEIRRKKVLDYLAFAKTEKIGTRRGLIKDTEGVEFNTPESYISNKYFAECSREFNKKTS